MLCMPTSRRGEIERLALVRHGICARPVVCFEGRTSFRARFCRSEKLGLRLRARAANQRGPLVLTRYSIGRASGRNNPVRPRAHAGDFRKVGAKPPYTEHARQEQGAEMRGIYSWAGFLKKQNGVIFLRSDTFRQATILARRCLRPRFAQVPSLPKGAESGETAGPWRRPVGALHFCSPTQPVSA